MCWNVYGLSAGCHWIQLCICQVDNDVMKGCKWEGEKLWMSCGAKIKLFSFAFFGCNKTWKHLERTRMKALVLYYIKKHLCLSRPTNIQLNLMSKQNVYLHCQVFICLYYKLHYTKMWLSWLQKYECSEIKPIIYTIFVVVYVKMA
jgi:hypothetical protein